MSRGAERILWLLVIAVLAAVLMMCSLDAHGQILCIEPPLQATPDEILRLQVEFMFAQKGYQINCENYDLAVSFYYLGVNSPVAVTDFYTEFSTVPGAVTGSVVTDHRQVHSGAWTMTVRLRGKVIPLSRTHSASLSTAVKNISKYLKHSRIYKLE